MDDDLDAVIAHYEGEHEEARLAVGSGQLELLRTQEIVRRHLPPAPARIIDIGGGTGVHAAWLARDGYAVHVVDITPRHVEHTRSTLGAHGVTAAIGDARHLDTTDASFDGGLLLGPLYHLVERHDRLQALREAGRVVRPGGIVAVAAISRFASIFDGMARGFIFDADFRAIVDRDLRDGRHMNDAHVPHWFTTAYFHRPEELAVEIAESGLEPVTLVGIEGLAGWLASLEERWPDEGDRRVIVDAARAVETEPSLLGLSAHLLAITRVPV